MDEQLIRELIELQKEENQLLKRYLWRFRFSLLSLLLLTTATAIGLGYLVYDTQSQVAAPPAPTVVYSTGTWSAPQPSGSILQATPSYAPSVQTWQDGSN